MEKNVYLFVCPNLADWEPTLAIAMISDRYTEVPKKHSYPVVTFGLSIQPIKSFGGLTITPDLDIGDVDPAKAAMIILPGSTIYEREDPTELVPLIRNCIRNNIPVAAICGGTLFLAKHGFLDSVRHTSAGPQWLKKHAPEYRGEQHYVHAPSVVDGGIITANPLGFVEFAANIMKTLDVCHPGFLDLLLTSIRQGYLNVDEFS